MVHPGCSSYDTMWMGRIMRSVFHTDSLPFSSLVNSLSPAVFHVRLVSGDRCVFESSSRWRSSAFQNEMAPAGTHPRRALTSVCVCMCIQAAAAVHEGPRRPARGSIFPARRRRCAATCLSPSHVVRPWACNESGFAAKRLSTVPSPRFQPPADRFFVAPHHPSSRSPTAAAAGATRGPCTRNHARS
eukprot:351639-Chlamydomonas_euryale.AAC.12